MYEVEGGLASKHNKSAAELHKSFVLYQHLCPLYSQENDHCCNRGASRPPGS